MPKKSKADAAEIAEAKQTLAELLPPGTCVYTSCNHVARSGMSRRLHCYIVSEGRIQNISGYVARVLGYPRNHRDGGFTVGGCGMDMGFHVVHTLSYALHGYPNGLAPFPPAETPESYRRAGYTLRHEWL